MKQYFEYSYIFHNNKIESIIIDKTLGDVRRIKEKYFNFPNFQNVFYFFSKHKSGSTPPTWLFGGTTLYND